MKKITTLSIMTLFCANAMAQTSDEIILKKWSSGIEQVQFLVEKHSKDPEVLRCGQKPDVIGPLEILPGVQWQAGSRTQKDRGNWSCSVQTVLLVCRKQPVPQGSNPSKVCLGNCVSLPSGMCLSV